MSEINNNKARMREMEASLLSILGHPKQSQSNSSTKQQSQQHSQSLTESPSINSIRLPRKLNKNTKQSLVGASANIPDFLQNQSGAPPFINIFEGKSNSKPKLFQNQGLFTSQQIAPTSSQEHYSAILNTPLHAKNEESQTGRMSLQFLKGNSSSSNINPSIEHTNQNNKKSNTRQNPTGNAQQQQTLLSRLSLNNPVKFSPRNETSQSIINQTSNQNNTNTTHSNSNSSVSLIERIFSLQKDDGRLSTPDLTKKIQVFARNRSSLIFGLQVKQANTHFADFSIDNTTMNTGGGSNHSKKLPENSTYAPGVANNLSSNSPPKAKKSLYLRDLKLDIPHISAQLSSARISSTTSPTMVSSKPISTKAAVGPASFMLPRYTQMQQQQQATTNTVRTTRDESQSPENERNNSKKNQISLPSIQQIPFNHQPPPLSQLQQQLQFSPQKKETLMSKKPSFQQQQLKTEFETIFQAQRQSLASIDFMGSTSAAEIVQYHQQQSNKQVQLTSKPKSFQTLANLNGSINSSTNNNNNNHLLSQQVPQINSSTSISGAAATTTATTAGLQPGMGQLLNGSMNNSSSGTIISQSIPISNNNVKNRWKLNNPLSQFQIPSEEAIESIQTMPIINSKSQKHLASNHSSSNSHTNNNNQAFNALRHHLTIDVNFQSLSAASSPKKQFTKGQTPLHLRHAQSNDVMSPNSNSISRMLSSEFQPSSFSHGVKVSQQLQNSMQTSNSQTGVSKNGKSQQSQMLSQQSQQIRLIQSKKFSSIMNAQVSENLLMKLQENEVLRSYVEQSGYSIEMFAFYMMKLYVHCTASDSNLSRDFPTLKVSEAILMQVREIFASNLAATGSNYSAVSSFESRFSIASNQLMPSAMIEDLGGLEAIRQAISKLLEHLCYESSVIQTFDEDLINEVFQASQCLLRTEQHLLKQYLEKLAINGSVSNAEFYHVKIALGKVMKSLGYSIGQTQSVQQRIEKKRGYFFSINDFSQDSTFRTQFLASIAKNKHIVGYFLDPSASTITAFYEILFPCFLGIARYIDLIDFLEHRLKTPTIPEIIFDDILDTILQFAMPLSTGERERVILEKDLRIKLMRLKQKAGTIDMKFLRMIRENDIDRFIDDIADATEAMSSLPDIQINEIFLKEYFSLVLVEEHQVFSIHDFGYAVIFHGVKNYENAFPIWMQAMSQVLLKDGNEPALVKQFVEYIQLCSI